MKHKNIFLIFIMLIIMSVSVSANTFFDAFNRSDDFQINADNWVGTDFLQQSNFYTRDQFIDNERLGAINIPQLTIDKSSTYYYNRNLFLPLNITFLYGWDGQGTSGYTYPNISNVYYNTFSNTNTPSFKGAMVGLGLNTSDSDFNKDNTNVFVNFRNDGQGATLYLNGQQIAFTSNFTSFVYGNKYDACWNCNAGSTGFGGTNQTPNYLNLYINTTFIGLKSWDVTESEPSTYQLSNSSISVNTNAFHNTKFFSGLDRSSGAASYFIDNFSINAGLNLSECVVPASPTYNECNSLAADYIQVSNLCTEQDITDCYLLIDQDAENIECTYTTTPTLNECNGLYEDFLVGQNDCNVFFYRACINDIPEDTDTVEEIETAIPDIFTKIQENIKLIFAIGIIVGIMIMISQYTKSWLVLILVAVLMLLLVTALGLISTKYLVYIVIFMIVIIILAILFRSNSED